MLAAKSGGRLVGLDVLRGFAAVAVMLHHHGQYYDELYPGRAPLSVNFFDGHFGVELFFIISGFVILMTIERKATVWAFAVARAARLMPCFLAALALATVILIVAPMPPLDTPTVGRFFANVTMAPLLFDQRVIDLPYWTLSYEMVFYISMAVLLALGLLRQIEWIALAWIAAGVLFTTLVDVEHHHRTSILLLAYYSNFFVIGMCLYLIHVGRARPVTWLALVLAIHQRPRRRRAGVPRLGRPLPVADRFVRAPGVAGHHFRRPPGRRAAAGLPRPHLLSALSRARRAGLPGDPLRCRAWLEHRHRSGRGRRGVADGGDRPALPDRAAGPALVAQGTPAAHDPATRGRR